MSPMWAISIPMNHGCCILHPTTLLIQKIMQVAPSSRHHPVAGSSSRPAASSNRPENDPVSKFDALYHQNALAKLRASVIVKSHLFAMSRVTGTLGSAPKKGYQLLAELQQSTHELLKCLSDPADGTGSGSDKPLLQRITGEAINAAQERITTGRATMIDRLRKSLHEVDTACNKYMVRDGHTAENFLALHAALSVCIHEFESAVRQRRFGSENDDPLKDLYEQTRAAVRQGMPRGELQRWNLQNQWSNANIHAAPSTESLGNRTLERDAPQVQPDLPLPAVDRENSPRVAAETGALTPAQQFPEVDRILEEMAQGSTKWNSGTRFTAPTKQLRQLKEILGRETEISERRPLREYILTRMVQAIDGLPAESAFTYEHRQMVVRLYQRILHHENLPKHDYFSRLKTYRQLRVVEQLDRLAPTPADFQQHLLISDASVATILRGLLKSRKLSEFRGTWIDIAAHQLQRFRKNRPSYLHLISKLINMNVDGWNSKDIVNYCRILSSEIEWLQTQLISVTENQRSNLNNEIDVICRHLGNYMRNTHIPAIRTACNALIESLQRTLNDLFTSNQWAYSNLLGRIVTTTHDRLNNWGAENQLALFNMIFSSMNRAWQSQVLNDDAEGVQLYNSVNEHLQLLLRRFMSEHAVPEVHRVQREPHRRYILEQLRTKFIELRTSNPGAHARLLLVIMQGWSNWDAWPPAARDSLENMVVDEVEWLAKNPHGYPAFFSEAQAVAAEYSSSLARLGRIEQLLQLPIYEYPSLSLDRAE